MKTFDFNNKIILAPMAGVTDLPFRILCKEQGCDILYTEMVSAKGIMYNNKNSEPLLHFTEVEKPIGVQLFGSEPEIMAEQAKRIEDRGYAFIDINMGCPVPKIVNNHEGSALMKNPKLVYEIIKAINEATKLPVTAKIRAGFDKDNKNAPEIAKVIEEAGAAAVAVHGRTREQYYSGEADWDIIRQVKESVHIPVIGNGDITSADDVMKMKEMTGCDAFMVGRAAKGNPWIFNEIRQKLDTGLDVARPSVSEIKKMMLRHAELMVEYKGEYIGIREMRKHVAWYTTGLKNSAKLRGVINQVETYEDLVTIIESIEE